MFIKIMKLTKAPTILGYAQLAALKLVASTPVMGEPEAGAIESRGVIRKHTINDLTMSGLLKAKVEPQKGGIVYLLTARGRKAMAEAEVAKKPPKGYRKVARTKRALAAA